MQVASNHIKQKSNSEILNIVKAMNRSDGLVRRVKSRATDDGNGGLDPSEQGASSNNLKESGEEFIDVENDIDDGDSKETRLTLMEEVLLLGLKDKEVC